MTELKGHPGLLNNTDPTNSVGGLPSFRCVSHATTCVLAEQGENQVVFTVFDPVQGRKPESTKVAATPDLISWDLSPDGTRVALSTFDYKAADVEIVSLAGGAVLQKLSVLPWTQLVAAAWTADGKGLFLGSFSSRGTSIVRTMNRHTKAVLQTTKLGHLRAIAVARRTRTGLRAGDHECECLDDSGVSGEVDESRITSRSTVSSPILNLSM